MTKSAALISLDNQYCQRIIDLILPIQQIEFNVPINLAGQQDLLDIEKAYQLTGGGFWGAMNDDELIGTIALMNIGHHAGAIRKMFVKKEFRGSGYGIAKRLLDILLDDCRRKKITDLYLGTVQMLHAAHRFYEKHGFEEIAVEALPDYFPRMMADNKFYHLKLNESI